MLSTLVLLFAAGAQASQLLDRNLVYRSPYAEFPELAHDTQTLAKRFLSRRQVQDASAFKDEHYATFYGGEFGNAPFIWNGGVNFTHNVASGDPWDSSVLLWTRAVAVPPAGSTTLPDQSVPVCVSYKISTSPDLSRPVDTGSAFTSYDVDWTVKVEATRLKSDTKYYYQFADCTNALSTSPVGQTRTMASAHTPATHVNGGKPLSIAVFSCSQYQAGYFNAYGFAAHNTTADLFVHLGDYIYESLGNGAKIGRAVLGRETATIKDYRQRLGQYRTDESLLYAHQHAPWITVWYDDHEVADNAWKAGTANSNDTTVGCSFSASGACFTDRKLAAVRAYHEWMPLRQVESTDKLRIWRNFQIGQLLDLTMLDTRQYDRDVTDVYYNTKFIDSLKDIPGRSLMGAAQEKWLFDTLSESQKRKAVWRIIGQQIVFTELVRGGSLNVDQWDGYRANRARILDHLYKHKIDNTIILAGDSHANWVSDLAHPNDTHYNPVTGAGAIGVEFGGTAVTSNSAFGSGITPANADIKSKDYVTVNSELQWSEGSYRGFFVMQIDSKTLNTTFYGMKNISYANLDGIPIANFIVHNKENKLSRPVAGGSVQAGVLKAQAVQTN